MKRWFTAALALVLVFVEIPAASLNGLAEVADAIEVTQIESRYEPHENGDHEGPVPEQVGLTLGEGTNPDASPEPAETVIAHDDGIARYGTLASGEGTLRKEPGGTEIAVISGSGALLVLSREGAWRRVAFNTAQGVVEGYLPEAALRDMDDAQIDAFMDAAADSGAAVLYNDDVNTPLDTLDISLYDAKNAEVSESGSPLAGESDAKDTGAAKTNAGNSPAETGASTDEPIEGPAAEVSPEQEVTYEESVDLLAVAASDDLVTIEMPDTLIMGVGQKSSALEAVLIYADGHTETASGLKWSSSNKKVVAVSASTGKLTAKKKGHATITAKSSSGISATCYVTVKTAPSTVNVKPSTLKLGAGGMVYALTTSVSDDLVTYTSNNTKVATVDSNGVITALKKGSAVITAKTYNGRTDTCKVTVYAQPGKVTLAKSEISMMPGEETAIRATAKTASGGKSAANFTFFINDNSLDPDCIVLDEHTGSVTSLFAGEALVTAMTHNGVYSVCRVRVSVSDELKSIVLPETAYMAVGETAGSLEVTAVYKDGHTDAFTDLTWSSSNKNVVTVNASTGKLTAKKSGTATITAKTDSGMSAKCKVTVAAAIHEINLAESEMTLGVGETRVVDGTITAPSGVRPTVIWQSSNAKVVSVDNSGNIKALSTGTAVITAAVGSVQDSCKVTVKKQPGSVLISPANGSITVGTSGRYTVTLPNGTAGAYTLTSSNPAIVSVSGNIVTGHKTGKVTITVTTYNGKKAKATLTVKSSSGGNDSGDDEEESSGNKDIETVIKAAESQLGMPYIYGSGYKEENPRGFDCSGLVYWAFYHVGIKLKDSSGRQGSDDTYPKITSIEALKRGDYVCFKSDRGSSTTTTHTGIYLGNGKFIHASSSAKKVIYSSFYEGDSADYWTDVFLWGRRVIS